MVSHLMNVDDELAEKVAKGLGLEQLPKAAEACRADAHGSRTIAGTKHPSQWSRELSKVARSAHW